MRATEGVSNNYPGCVRERETERKPWLVWAAPIGP
jgi:hypothetical protein